MTQTSNVEHSNSGSNLPIKPTALPYVLKKNNGQTGGIMSTSAPPPLTQTSNSILMHSFGQGIYNNSYIISI